jgi:hypothetical protein
MLKVAAIALLVTAAVLFLSHPGFGLYLVVFRPHISAPDEGYIYPFYLRGWSRFISARDIAVLNILPWAYASSLILGAVLWSFAPTKSAR